MTSDEIESYLREIDNELAKQNVIGEICIYGGAAMCLAFKARPSTKDVDAIFEPVKSIRGIISQIAEKHNLRQDWLNFAVKMFVVNHEKRILFDLPNLKVFVPNSDYLLAMKVLALRAESFDSEDVEFLIETLQIDSLEKVLEIVKNYYPNKELKTETIFQLEELFEKRK